MSEEREEHSGEEPGEDAPMCPLEDHCEWCNSTGDVKRTKYIYWGTVLAIVVFLALVYVFAVMK
ncbi:MAG: hypothetical protein ACWGN7_04575 [Thermodesulfovibrionales bacterium]